MEKGQRNYGRFYAAFNDMLWSGDRDELKRTIVSQYTNGRTEHLHEMTRQEYASCCDGLEHQTNYRSRLKKKRSECLRQLQKLGVDTSDWQRVNDFCMNARIAGKPFARLTLDDLDDLRKKLYAIAGNGGLKRGCGSSYTKSFWVLPLKGGDA